MGRTRDALRKEAGLPIKKFSAEFVGTFTLVLFGCGAAVIAGKDIGVLGIAFAFGFALIAMAYGIGPISGCHINPAVSLGVFAAGRMTVAELGQYVAAQILGGIAGAAVLWAIVSGKTAGYDISASGLGQNGWGPGYLGEYAIMAAILFVVVILGSTGESAPTQLAGGTRSCPARFWSPTR